MDIVKHLADQVHKSVKRQVLSKTEHMHPQTRKKVLKHLVYLLKKDISQNDESPKPPKQEVVLDVQAILFGNQTFYPNR